MDRKIEADQDCQTQEDVGKPDLPVVSAGQNAAFILLFVGIQNLGQFLGNDISLIDNHIAGTDKAHRLRNPVVCLTAHERSQLLVKNEVRDYKIVDAASRQRRIDRYLGERGANRRKQGITGARKAIDLRRRDFLGPLIALDIDNLTAFKHLLPRFGDDTLGEDAPERRDNCMFKLRVLEVIQA